MAPALQVKVKYLAVAREIAGAREEVIEISNPSTIMDLLVLLVQKHGQKMREYLFDQKTGEPRPHLQFFLNDKSIHLISGLKTALANDATLAIVPPVSGG